MTAAHSGLGTVDSTGDGHWCAGSLALQNGNTKQHKQQTLDCSARQCPWCKYSLCGRAVAAHVPSRRTELGRNAHSWALSWGPVPGGSLPPLLSVDQAEHITPRSVVLRSE